MSVNVGEAIGYLDLDTSGFTKGFKSALQELQAFKNSASSMGDKVIALGSAMTKAGSTMTKGITLPLVGLGTAAVTTTAGFESAMSQVQATMGITADATSKLGGQTVNTMEALEDLAKEMGASTKFSATEAAAAINNMAMAGYDVEQIYQALPQVLSLASAGALDLDYATQLVANGLNVMGLETSDAAEMADKLAVTASKAYGSVSDFGEGILIAGGQAKLANVSLTDTLTALGILGDNGISASEGGTALRNTLKNLYTPTTDAAKALEELGVTTANSDGTLRDFQEVLKDLGGSLDGLTEEQRVQYMSRIFDTETISAANALLGNCGDRWDELSASIDNANGAAEKMADTQLDNLSGQLTILKSSLEGAAIAFGELLLPLIKKVTSAVQRFVDWINNLSDRQKEIIVTIAEVSAVVGPVLIIVGKMIKQVVSVMKVVKVLKTAIVALNAAMSANPIGLIITAIGLLVTAFIYLWNHCEGFRNFFIKMWEGLKNAVKAVVDWIKENWQAMLLFLINPLAGIFKYCYDHFEGFRNFVDNIVQSVKAFFVDLWNSITLTLSSLVEALRVFFTETIPNALQSAIDWVKNFADEIAKFFTETIPETLSQLVEWFKSLPGKIWDALLSALAKVRQWGTDLKNWAQTKIPEVVTKIVNKFKKLPKKLVSVGKNLVEGLWNGINDKVDWILDKIKDFGDEVLNGIKDFFGIASPSKKTKEVGKYLVEGLSLGIEDNEDMVIDSADSLAGGLLGALRSLVGKLSGILELVSNPFDALDKQRQAYDAITQSINNQISALRTLKALQEAFFIGTTLLYGEDALEAINGHSTASQRPSGYSDPYISGPKGVSYSFTFYSPEAINPTSAAKLMKQTAQQMSMDMS